MKTLYLVILFASLIIQSANAVTLEENLQPPPAIVLPQGPVLASPYADIVFLGIIAATAVLATYLSKRIRAPLLITLTRILFIVFSTLSLLPMLFFIVRAVFEMNSLAASTLNFFLDFNLIPVYAINNIVLHVVGSAGSNLARSSFSKIIGLTFGMAFAIATVGLWKRKSWSHKMSTIIIIVQIALIPFALDRLLYFTETVFLFVFFSVVLVLLRNDVKGYLTKKENK